MATAVKNVRNYLFEKAHEAVVVLHTTLPALSANDRETLEILSDPELTKEILKRSKETSRLHRQRKTLSIEQIKARLND